MGMRRIWVVCGWILGVSVGAGAVLLGCGNPGPPGPPPGTGGGGGAGINPLGLFFNRFTGPINGGELLQIMRGSSSRRFLMTTLDGFGVDADINSVGMINIVNVAMGAGSASGTGLFSDTRNFTAEPTITVPGLFTDAAFTYTDNRIFRTDASFPIEATTSGSSPEAAGTYKGLFTLINPETGAATGAQTEELTLSVSGSLLRLTRLSGDFYQGVFVSPTRVAFRQVNTGTGRWASFVGSESSTGQDMVGVLDFNSTGFTATLAFQTRTPRGAQTQQVLTIDATVITNQNGNVAILVQNQTAFGEVFVRAYASTNPTATALQVIADTEVPLLGGLPLEGGNATGAVACLSAASVVVTADVFEFSGGLPGGISNVFRMGTNFNCGNQILVTVNAVNGTQLFLTGVVLP